MNKNRILIVEDERITAEDLKITLVKLGYKVTGIASSAETFYNCLKTEIPDLVLMDIYIKGKKDGIELATEVKEKYHIPVIYLTAYSDQQILERAKISEPFGYILKPFEERELHSNIEMALHKYSMEKHIAHLNDILKAIRDINQLIVRVSSTRELLEKTCQILITTKAYTAAWMILIDENQNFKDGVTSGDSSIFSNTIETFKNGYRPPCLTSLSSTNEILFTKTGTHLCTDCVLAPNYPHLGALVVKISYQKTILGYIGVVMSPHLVTDKEELELFAEIADDLGLAINNLEQQKKKSEIETALNKSELFFRHVFDFAAGGMAIVSTEGKFLKCNSSFCKLIGHTEAELTNFHFNDITHSEDKDIGLEIMKKVVSAELDKATFENRYLKPDGTVIWAFVSVSLVKSEADQPGFFITHIIDLTEKRQAEQDLIDSEEQYRTFMNSTKDLAFLKDEELRYIMINKAQKEFFNRSENKILGFSDNDLMSPEIAVRCGSSDKLVLDTLETVVTVESANDKIYETRKFPVRLRNKQTGVGAFIRDVTEQIRATQALLEKTEELERFNSLMIGRELKMVQLKEEINQLLISAGQKEKYKIVK